MAGVQGSYADEKTAQQLARGEAYYDWRDLERGFAPDAQTREICRLYQVWDAPMWEKLQEIAAKHGLALHTARTAITGAGNQPREYGCYEDGSFVVSIERAQYMYTLYLERTGYLPVTIWRRTARQNMKSGNMPPRAASASALPCAT